RRERHPSIPTGESDRGGGDDAGSNRRRGIEISGREDRRQDDEEHQHWTLAPPGEGNGQKQRRDAIPAVVPDIVAHQLGEEGEDGGQPDVPPERRQFAQVSPGGPYPFHA